MTLLRERIIQLRGRTPATSTTAAFASTSGSAATSTAESRAGRRQSWPTP